jgi:cyclic dehypoxanthinyl futalosine synthase
MIEENVVSAANTTHRTTIAEMERLIVDAGFTPARRTQDYRLILPGREPVPASALPPATPAGAAMAAA